MTRKQIGTCAVDSGQILLIDPCYINSSWDHENSYNEVCDVSLGKDQAGYVQNLLATVTSTGWGDGVYPVYAEYRDGRIASVTIEFMGEDLYGEDDENEE